MELWTEARALKESLRGEAITHQVIVSSEELSRTSSAEDFSVEYFLDFSEEVQVEEEELVSVTSSQEAQEQDCCIFSSQPCIFDQLPSLPDEYVEELEWVSRVVDDCSSPDVSLLLTKIHKAKPSISSQITVKPRTKRSRSSLTGDRVWPLISDNQHATGEHVRKKKQETAVVFQRRCSHCGTNNTPQWRTGPVGPKTLCNACGVRFKSGRLCPEYRPADSPTFSNEIHSNLHRKVLELRKSKVLVEETGEATTKSDQVKFVSNVVDKT
ncbi:GATA transcription factor 3 [Hirschfeldia incana]|nr:GATA transcription factor 3 [Hirschfeldia incana]